MYVEATDCLACRTTRNAGPVLPHSMSSPQSHGLSKQLKNALCFDTVRADCAFETMHRSGRDFRTRAPTPLVDLTDMAPTPQDEPHHCARSLTPVVFALSIAVSTGEYTSASDHQLRMLVCTSCSIRHASSSVHEIRMSIAWFPVELKLSGQQWVEYPTKAAS